MATLVYYTILALILLLYNKDSLFFFQLDETDTPVFQDQTQGINTITIPSPSVAGATAPAQNVMYSYSLNNKLFLGHKWSIL